MYLGYGRNSAKSSAGRAHSALGRDAGMHRKIHTPTEAKGLDLRSLSFDMLEIILARACGRAGLPFLGYR